MAGPPDACCVRDLGPMLCTGKRQVLNDKTRMWNGVRGASHSLIAVHPTLGKSLMVGFLVKRWGHTASSCARRLADVQIRQSWPNHTHPAALIP